MDKKIMKHMISCFVDPIDSRILLEIKERKTATAKELALTLTDISQASLYRHLGKMVKHGVLIIAEERPVRALMEKVYALNMDENLDIPRLLKENRGDVYMSLFAQFSAALMREFADYTARDGIDILKDGSGFSTGPIAVNSQELETLMIQIGELIAPYRMPEQAAKPGRKMHSLALIVTPPKQGGEKNE